jgi:hypothetical protein
MDEIARCQANDAHVSHKMSTAGSLRYAKDLKDQFRSLELYREIAEVLPKSSFTADSRRQAQSLSETLRSTWLTRLQSAEAKLQAGSLNDNELDEAGSWAALIRQGKLAWEEEEKRIVRTIEVASQRRQAENLPKTGSGKKQLAFGMLSSGNGPE